MADNKLKATLELDIKGSKELSDLQQKVDNTANIFATFDKTINNLADSFGSISLGAGLINKDFALISSSLDIFQSKLDPFRVLNERLKESDNSAIRLAGTLNSTVASIRALTQSGITYLSVKAAELAQNIGGELVNANLKAQSAFAEDARQVLIFRNTIEGLAQQIGISEDKIKRFESTILKLSQTTEFSDEQVKNSARQLFSIGTQAGLSAKQIDQLLQRTVDLAAASGDLGGATSAVISALSGQTKGLKEFGVLLKDIDLDNYSKQLLGLNFNKFDDLDKASKSYVTFNALLDKSSQLQGQAALAADTIVGSQKRLKNNLDELIEAYGEGVNVIEDTSIATNLLNTAVIGISPEIAKFAGALSAIAGRTVQAAGYLTTLGLKIGTALAAFNTIKKLTSGEYISTFLGTGLDESFKKLQDFASSIPLAGGLINQNLNVLKSQLQKNGLDLSKTFSEALNIKYQPGKFKEIINQVGANIADVLKTVISFSTGIEKSSLSVAGVLRAVFSTAFTAAATAVRFLSTTLLALLANPIVLTVVGIAAAFYGLYKALAFIEKQTKIFSSIWEEFKSIFVGTESLFAPVKEFFINLGDLIAGFFVDKVAFAIKGVLKIAQTALGFFSKEKADNIQKYIDKIDKFRSKLNEGGSSRVSNFKIDDADRSIDQENSQKGVLNEDALKRRKELLDEIRKRISEIKQEVAVSSGDFLGKDISISNIRKQFQPDIDKTSVLSGQEKIEALKTIEAKIVLTYDEERINAAKNKIKLLSDSFKLELDQLKNKFKNDPTGLIKAQEELKLAFDPLGKQLSKSLDEIQPTSERQKLELQSLSLSAQNVSKDIESVQEKLDKLDSKNVTNIQQAFNDLRERLTITKGKISEIQEVAIQAGQVIADNFASAFTDFITGAKSAKDSFKDFALSTIKNIVQIINQLLIAKAIKAAFGFADGGPVTGTESPAGLAKGGFAKSKFADGGRVGGPGNPSLGVADTVSAKLSVGEFVQPFKAVQHYGVEFMEAIRTLKLPKPGFNTGGLVARVHSIGNNLSQAAIPRFADGGVVKQNKPALGEVRIINEGGEKQAAGVEQNFDGESLITTIFMKDLKVNGPIAQGIGSAFRLNRAT